MEVFERINNIIKQRKITKRKFAEILRDLDPKLKSTGEIPNEKTIYKYLSGDVSIPIELISYIAEALDITEQELFDTTTQTKVKLFKYVKEGLDQNQVAYLNSLSSNAQLISDVQNSYGDHKTGLNFYHENQLKKLMELLEFAPQPLVERIINKLEEIKKISLSEL
jgi:transcriptional regulator with XRE-family HTH domain